LFDQRRIRAEAQELAQSAQVPAITMTALMMGLCLAMNQVLQFLITYVDNQTVALFFEIFVQLVTIILQNGFLLYCISIYKGQLTDYPIIFDAFSFSGKLIALTFLKTALVSLGSMLFFFPGLILFYRYRFALYNLCENPELGVLEAMQMSATQTRGHMPGLLLMDLSFAGWVLLSDLPYMFYLYCEFLGQPLPLTDGWVTFICNFTALVVGLFWMAHHRLCILACLDRCRTPAGTDSTSLPPWSK